MKKFFRMLGKPWVLTTLGFAASAVFIWLIGPFLAFAEHRFLASPLARLVAILLLALLWLAALLWRQARARRADRQLIEGMAESEQQAPPGTAAKTTAATAEKQALKARFEQAVTLLRKPGGKRGKGASSLYELPWYILIGPPGCGKTTALAQSGIDFPLAERFGQGAGILPGIGGTRNCDWWISNEAVLIDTAGRYTTQDSEAAVDSAAWSGFLELLRKYRRRRPINGAIVAFSLADLMTLDEAALAHHYRAIRRRLQELVDQLGISIPIYLLLTKADLLSGFVQFFDDLGREERHQVWGTTFPLQADASAYTARFRQEFDLLHERLTNRLHWRLNSERDHTRRALILAFPQQFASIREPIERFLHEVFQESRFEQPIMLRGVYFSSGTQEGTPIDRLIGSMAASFGLEQPQQGSNSGRGKSYFITDLLRAVIFPERNLASTNRQAERRMRWLTRGAYAAILLLTIGAVLVWTTSFTQNKAFTTELQTQLQHYTNRQDATIELPADYQDLLARLDGLRATLDEVTQTTDSPPWSMRFGLYRGGGIAKATHDAYQRTLNVLLVPALATTLQEQLVAAKTPPLQYELLKLYLMLVDPAHMDARLFRLWATSTWAEQMPTARAMQQRLAEHLSYLLERSLITPIDPNRRLVKQVRERLEQQPLAELVYGRLQYVPAVRESQPLTFETLAGQHADTVFTPATRNRDAIAIPGLFTYRGFYQLFQPQSLKLIGAFKQEAWVYGDELSAIIEGQLSTLENDVLALYIDDYIQRWDNTLAQLDIVPFSDLQQAIRVTGQLIRLDSPIKKLLNTLADNTMLTRLPKGTEGLADMGLKKLSRQNPFLASMIGEARRGGFDAAATDIPPKRVERHFDLLQRVVDASKGAGDIDRIQRLLTALYSDLSLLEPASGFSVRPDTSVQQDIFQRLRTEAARHPDPVRRWLRQIATGAQTVALGNTSQRLNEIYQARVGPLCERMVNNRYPFNPEARREVNLRDFGEIFGEQGLLDRFFHEHLEPFVDLSSKPWRWRQSAQLKLGLSDDSLQQFQRANSIQQAFFPQGGKAVKVRFSLIPEPLDPALAQFDLRFGGQHFTFTTPQPVAIDGEWPGPTVSGQLTMQVTTTAGEVHEAAHSGQWAFYRLVNPRRLQPGIDRFPVNLSVQQHTIRFELRAFSVLTPFGMEEIRQFTCPKTL